MEVILKQDVKGLGRAGEKVRASDGYARNFLIPKKLAVEANAQTLAEFRSIEAAKRHRSDRELAAAKEAKKKLEGRTLRLSARAGEGGRLFGSVTAKEVAAAIADQFGVKVDRRKLTVEDIKRYGTYPVEVRLYAGVSASLYVLVGE